MKKKQCPWQKSPQDAVYKHSIHICYLLLYFCYALLTFFHIQEVSLFLCASYFTTKHCLSNLSTSILRMATALQNILNYSFLICTVYSSLLYSLSDIVWYLSFLLQSKVGITIERLKYSRDSIHNLACKKRKHTWRLHNGMSLRQYINEKDVNISEGN